MDLFRYDFGYDWPWTLGHAVPIAVFGGLILLAIHRRWRKWTLVLFAVPFAWGVAGLLIVNGALRFSLPTKLPTERFLQAGSGRVLDAGAGSGRSTVMVLRQRPAASVTALDIFASGYGIDGNTPERLERNAAAAGGADRLTIVTGDMREMTLAGDSFDGVVSAYAIDHLSQADVRKTLGEVRRVLKPGGDLLLLVIRPDWYVRIAYPMAAEHGYFGPRDAQARWQGALAEAGFALIEVGHQPGTLYLLARSAD